MNTQDSSAPTFPVADSAQSEIQPVFHPFPKSVTEKGFGEKIRRYMNSPCQPKVKKHDLFEMPSAVLIRGQGRHVERKSRGGVDR